MTHIDLRPTEAIIRDYTYERVYPLPNGDAYKAVNSAVAYAISMMSRGHDPVRDEVAGYTKYTIMSRDGIVFQLHVLYVSERFANVRLNPIAPGDPDNFTTWQRRVASAKSTLPQIAQLFALCNNQIAKHLRYAVELEGIDPPPPPKNDLDALLTWQEIYYPAMKDQELADIADMGVQSIRNGRHRLSHTKRIERGKPRGK